MRVERIIANIKTLGPGNRLGIWVSGCSRHCEGCVSERLQQYYTEDFPISTLLDGFDYNDFDGVTISGGEPFEQIEELKNLIIFLKNNSIEDILIYTGYTLNELKIMHNPSIDYILNNIDVLIDGPYIKKFDDQHHNLKGSTNQIIHYFNQSLKEKYESYITQERIMQEFRIENTLLGIGIPNQQYIDEFKNKK